MSKNMKTFKDIQAQENDSEDSGNEAQSFFVGGSEHSGQQVMGPNRNDIRHQLFEAARRAGAETVTSAHATPENKSARAFSGGGVKLGGAVSAATSSSNPQVETIEDDTDENDSAGNQTVVAVRLCVYEDGFTIDDGPFRAFAENERFTQQLLTGRIPNEIQMAHPGMEIDLRMEQKSGQYVAPPPQAFHGTGARLGAIVPNVSTDVAATLPLQTEEEKAKCLADAQNAVNLDEGSPVTQIQIRFENNNRMIAKFNHTHPVHEIRSFVVTAAPEYAFIPFNLLQSFPRELIENETVSIAEAGLINSVVIVKVL